VTTTEGMWWRYRSDDDRGDVVALYRSDDDRGDVVALYRSDDDRGDVVAVCGREFVALEHDRRTQVHAPATPLQHIPSPPPPLADCTPPSLPQPLFVLGRLSLALSRPPPLPPPPSPAA